MGSLHTALNLVTGEVFDGYLWDYGNSEHFDNLWNLSWDAAFHSDQQPFESDEFYIIVSGPLPEEKLPILPVLQDIDFKSHFGALSWATSHLIALSRLPDSDSGKRKCGIIVIDSSPISEGSERLLSRMFSSGSTDSGGGIPNVIYLRNPSLVEISESISRFRRELPGIDTSHGDLLATLLHAIIVSERVTHHAIANILGAAILENEANGSLPLDEDGRSQVLEESMPLQHALLTLCKCIWRHGIKPWRTGANKDPFGSSLLSGSVLLLDDMSEVWKPVLDAALPNAKVDAVMCDEYPTFLKNLPTRLKSIKSEGLNITPHALTGNESFPDDEDFILFLDLRILPSGEDWTKFYEHLALVALDLHESQDRLPWLGTRTERKSWKDWLDQIVKGKELHPETLLAQLLSLLDPHLPIIIFSSSHSSDFSEPLAPFGNITTGFRKPTPASLLETKMSTLKKEFAETCERAQRVRRTRIFFKSLKDLRVDFRPSSSPHCELFIDESGGFGDASMNLSGVGICGELGLINQFHRALHEVFLGGLSPGATCFHQEDNVDGNRVNRPGEFFPKRPSDPNDRAQWVEHWNKVQSLAEAAQNLAVEFDLSLFIFSYEFPTDDSTFGPSWLPTEGSNQERQLLDVGYTSALVRILESVVFDVFQALSYDHTLAVDFASRDAVANYQVGGLGEEIRRNLLSRWGVATTRRNSKVVTKCKSIGDRTPLRLLELAFTGERRKGAPPANLKVTRARACLMKNWDENNPIADWSDDELLAMPIHYLADFISNAVKNREERSAGDFLRSSIIEGWIENGLVLGWGQWKHDDWTDVLAKWEGGDRISAARRCMPMKLDDLRNAPFFVRAKLTTWKIQDLLDTELRSLYGE